MAKGINKVILIGSVGKDPETRFAASGSAITNFSLATNEEWKDKTSGDKQSRTEWHRCCSFNKLAEIIGQYVKKGSKLYIEGSLRTRKWQGQDGQDKYTTEIVVSEMQMLDSRSDGSQYNPPAGQSTNAAQEPSGGAAAMPNDFNDNIPF